MRKSIVGGILALGAAALIYGCTLSEAKKDVSVKGVVEEAGQKVANATVWLIPAADVAAMGKTPIEIKKDAKNDEPLEDNLAANRGRYLNAKTNAKGEFSFADVPGGKYFVYVEPADSKLPARWRQVAQGAGHDELAAAPVTIKVSGNVPPDAKYIGSSRLHRVPRGPEALHQDPAPPRHHGHRQAEQAAGLLPLPGVQQGSGQAHGRHQVLVPRLRQDARLRQVPDQHQGARRCAPA